jgi:hypothetical protein
MWDDPRVVTVVEGAVVMAQSMMIDEIVEMDVTILGTTRVEKAKLVLFHEYNKLTPKGKSYVMDGAKFFKAHVAEEKAAPGVIFTLTGDENLFTKWWASSQSKKMKDAAKKK